MPEPTESDAGALLGGRFRVEAELGRGGMARVLRVLDERSGERYALKQLTGRAKGSPTLRAMFEREYHTLVELAHPRIVRAFDYGFDAGQSPYYTMELLAGTDARELAHQTTIEIERVCLLLRDCAAALSLVHARRSVHRDVSPRNVWCTPDGRAKLIDFGTLVAMGAEVRVAGTPPFIAPEAFYQQPLDARCDLYSLGAVAYFLLTGRSAYRARTLAELPELWKQRPDSPNVVRPEIPTALSELVMALLSLDARGRPGSASEVFERLTVIGKLPSEHEPHLAQAFLSAPTLVGRERERRALRARLQRALQGKGGRAALVAHAGLGRTRMLASLALDAKLQGAATVMVGASSVASGSLAIATAIVEGLLETLPGTAELCADMADMLSHLSLNVHEALGGQPLRPLAPHERSRKLPSAVVKLLERVSERHPVVIAVDDLHRADAGSLWVLGRLALRARKRRLWLVTSCDEATLDNAPPALAQLVGARHRITLAPLTAADTRALLSSLFAGAPALDNSAAWLHEICRGSPQACVQYAQYLVDRGVARYERGRWRLPSSLSQAGLPDSFDAMLEQRLDTLSSDARTLALGLALARDQTRATWQPEMHVPFEAYAELLDSPEPGRANAALDELLRANLLQVRDGSYILGQTAIIDALLRASDIAARRRMHARLADVFLRLPNASLWLQIRHLLLADESGRARERACTYNEHYQRAEADWNQMRLSMVAEASMRVLEAWKQQGGTPLEGILLRQPILLISSVYDWQLASVGAEQIAQLSHDAGLEDCRQFSGPAPQQRLAECVQRAHEQYQITPSEQRGLPPDAALRELSYCAFQLHGAFVNSHDLAQAEALRLSIAPLTEHSASSALLVELCHLGFDRLHGRELGDRMPDLGVTRLYAATDLPATLRQGGAGVNVHIQTVEDARRGRDSGFALMDLVSAVVGDDIFLVVHGRFLLHAFLGHSAQANQLYRQIEIITEDDVWRRNAFLFAEAELYILLGNLRALAGAATAMRSLATRFPGWAPWAHWAEAEVLRMHGDLAGCLRELDAALPLAAAGAHRAWTRIAPSRAEALLSSGDSAGALREASEILRIAQALDLDRMTLVEAERIRALAHSQQAQHLEAQAACQRAFERATALGCGGLPLAKLHETAARLAQGRGDFDACSAALKDLWSLIEYSDSPKFIRAYESLRDDSQRHGRARSLPSANTLQTDTTHSQYATLLSDLPTQLRSLNVPTARAERALSLLLEDVGSRAGQLYLRGPFGLFEAASIPSDESEILLDAASQFFTTKMNGAQTITEAETTRDETLNTHWAGTAFEVWPVLLSDYQKDPPVGVGVAMIATDGTQTVQRAPRNELVTMIAQILVALGDVSPIALASD